jgi:filamentous hemagglutinin family protein
MAGAATRGPGRAARKTIRAGRAPRPAPAQPPRKLAVRRDWLLATTALLPIAAGPVMAQPAPTTGPTGGQVVAGQAGISRTPGRTTITQGTDRAAIDWQQFNVGSQHTVQFVQPSQGSWTLNRVVGPDPSVIAGRVQANGGVAIVNQSGMVFAGGAQVNVGSLIASAAGITNENFMAGRMAFDQAARPGARVENRGTITVADRGLAALVGPGVSNSGVIRARLGRVALGAAETFVLDLAGDGLIGIDVTQAVRTAPTGGDTLVTNSGVIEAAGGSVLITAHAASGLVEDLVRQTGRIEAPTVGTRTGEVAIRAEGGGVRVDGRVAATGGRGERGGQVAAQASGTVTVAAGARIDASGGAGGGRVLVGTTGRGREQRLASGTTIARGAEIRADATGRGRGGEVIVNSTDRTEMRGLLSARGGAAGGDGGFIEVSGQGVFVLNGLIDLRAPSGALGDFLLDPRNIVISASATPTLPGGSTIPEVVSDLAVVAGSVDPAGTVTADNAANTTWVRVTPGAIESFAAGNIILDADRQIIVDSAVNRTNAGNLTLQAGQQGGAPTNSGDITVRAGADISVNGALTLTTPRGAISIAADLRATEVTLVGRNGVTQSGGTIQHVTGAATALPLTVTVSNGAVTIAQAGNGNFDLAASTASGNFTIAAETLAVSGNLAGAAMSLTARTGALTLGADLRATGLTLAGEAGITQTGGNIQHSTNATTVLAVGANSGAGGVTLDAADNGSLSLGPASAQGAFTVVADTIATTGAITAGAVTLTADTGALTLGGNIRATSVALTGQAGITQSTGTIAHATDGDELPITANAPAGAILLAQDGNGVFALGASAASAGLTVAAESLRITDAIGGTAVALTARTGGITIEADIRATGLALEAFSGISQTGGTIAHSAGPTTTLDVAASVVDAGDVALGLGNGAIQVSGGTADGDFTLTSAEGLAIGVGGTLSVAGQASLTVQGDGNGMTLAGELRAQSVALAAAGTITQDGTGVLVFRNIADGSAAPATALPVTVAVTGTAHDVILDGDNGRLRVNSATTEDGGIGIRARNLDIAGTLTAGGGGGMTLVAYNSGGTGSILMGAASAITAGLLNLNAARNVTQQAGGTIDLDGGAGRLTLRGQDGAADSRAGSLTLAGTNQVGELDLRTLAAPAGALTGAIDVTMQGNVSVVRADGTAVTLTAGGLTIAAGEAGVVATGDVRLVADALTVNAAVTAGANDTLVLRTDTLALGGTGSLSVAGGTFELGPRSGVRVLEVGGVADPTRLQATAAMVEATGATTIRLGSTTVPATGTVTGAGLVVSEALTLGTGTTLEAVASGGITVNGDLAAGTVRLNGGGAIALGAVEVTALTGGIELRAGGAITQNAAGALVAQGGTRDLVAHAGAGGIDLAGTGNFRLADGGTPSGAGGARSLYATGNIAFSTTGTLSVAATAEANAPGATLALQGASVVIQAPLVTPSTTGRVALTATGDGATISQTAAGTITASVLSASADGAVLLGAAPNVVASLGSIAFEESFSLRTAGALAINAAVGPTTLGSDADITIRLDAGNLALNASIAAGAGTVVLAAEGGSITQSALGSRITAGRVEVTAGGDATLLAATGGGNAVAVLGDSSVAGTLSFNAAGDLMLDGVIAQDGTGRAMAVQSGGTLTLSDGSSLRFASIGLTAAQAMTLSGTVGVTGEPAPVSTVRLRAGADITQGPGGIIAASLGVETPGAAVLTSGANDVRAIAADTTGAFSLATTGPLTTTDLGLTTGFGALGGVTASAVTLSATGITVVSSALTGFTGYGIATTLLDGTVTLRADRFAATGAILTGNPFIVGGLQGSIDIAPRTLSRAVRIGTDAADTLFLSTTTLAQLRTRTLVVGHDSPTAGTLTVGSDVTTLSATSAVTLRGGAIALDATFALDTEGLLSLHATAGDIVQGTAGGATAARLSAVADAGSVLLGSPGFGVNLVDEVSGSAGANESFTFRAGGNFTVAAPGITATGGEVDLSSFIGGIGQATGARITAARLRVSAPGVVALDGGGSANAADLNSVGTLLPSSGGSLTVRNAGALRVEGATATAGLNGSVTLEAPGLTLAGDITANQPGGRAVLRTGAVFDTPAAGTIVQESGVIRTGALSASAAGGIILGGANEIDQLVAGTNAAGGTVANAVVTAPGGAILLANDTANLEVIAPVNVGALGAISILADGLSVAPGLTATAFLAPGGVVQFAPFTPGRAISVGGAGGINETTIATEAIEGVSAARLIIGALAPEDQVSSGTITLRGVLDLMGAGAPQVLELRAAGDILADGFALSVANISAVATGTVRLGTTDSRIGQVVAGAWDGVSGIRAGGPVLSLTTAGVDAATGLFTIAAPISLVGAGAGGTITLQAPDFAILAGATVDTGAAGRIEVRSPRTLSLGGAQFDGGTARLTATELDRLDANGGTLAAFAPDIRLRGPWALAPGAAARLELGLTAGGTGTVRQIEGGLSAGGLFVTALQGTGSVQIAQAGNALPVVSVQALGAVNVATEGALEIRRTTTTGGTVTYRATDITLSDTGLAAGQVTIDNGGRAVTLTATTGDITGITAGAAVRAGTLTATADGEIRLGGGNTIVTGALAANDGILLRASGTTTVGAVGTGGAGSAVAGTIDIAAAALTLNDVLGSGTVLLDATTGSLLQNNGARLSAATLSAEAAGEVRLAGANGDGTARNTIQDLSALSAGGNITLRNALALTLDLPISVGTDRVLTLEAAGLTLAQNLAAAGPNGRIILRTGSFNGGVATGGDITQTGGTISAATLAALAAGNVSIDRDGNAIGALGGGLGANGLALGLGLSAGGDATLRSNGFGGSATLGVTGALQVGTGRALTLRANDLAIGAELRAPAGIITLLPVTANGSIGYVLGGAAGSVNAGRITLDGTELGFLPSGTAAAELRLGAVGQTGSVGITGTVDLVDGAAPRVGLLALAGNGALTQGAGSVLDVAALSADFPNGAVLLDPGVAGNRIGTLAGVTAGGAVDIRGGAGLMDVRGSGITAAAGSSITLRADDLDIQAALRVAGGTVFILPETLGRAITLGGPDAAAGTLALGTNEIARIGGNGGVPALRLVIGADGTPGVGGTVRAAGDVLVAGDVRLRAGGVDRVGTLDLVAGTPGTAGGSVRQSAGTVDVAALTGTAQGDFQIARAANAFDTATGIAAGTQPVAGATGVVALGTAGALAASDITAPVSVRVSAGGALAAGGITAPQVTLDGGTVTLTGLIQGSTSVAINSAGAVSQDAGALVVTGLFTLNGGSVSLPEDNQIVELGGLVATGPVLALNTVLPVLVSGAVSAVGSLSLTTDQGLRVAPGGSISVTGGPGNATFAAGGAIDYAGTLAATGAATLTAGGALSFTGTAATGGAIAFDAGAGLTLAGTIGAGGAFTGTAAGAIGTTAQITAAGDVTLTAGGSLTASGRVESTGGALALTGVTQSIDATLLAEGAATLRATGGAIDITGSVLAVGAVTIEAAASLTTADSVVSGGDLRLQATTGTVSLAGVVQAVGTTTVVAGGAIGTTAAVAGLGDVTFTAGGALTAGGTIESGANLALTGGTGLVANGTFAAGGAARLTATTGALTLAGTLTAGGTVDVTGSGAVGTTAQVTGGADTTFTAGGGLAASGRIESTGGGVALTGATGLVANGTFIADGAARLAATSGALTLDGALTAGGAATVAAGGAITTTAQVTASADTTFTAGGTLTASGRIASTGGDLALTGATGLTATATLVADGNATLRATGGAIDLTGSLVAGGSGTIAAAGALTSNGTVRTGTTLAMTAGGTVTLGGTHAAGTGLAVTAGGGIAATGLLQAGQGATLTAQGGNLTQSGTLLAGGNASLSAGGTLANTGSIAAGGALALAAGGSLSQTGGAAAGTSLAITAGGAVLLSGQTTAGTDLDVNTPGTATLTAGKITAGNAVRLTAGAGVLAQSFQIDPATILLQTGGAMSLTDSSLVSGQSIRLGAGTITLRRTNVTTGTLDVDATGTLVLDGGRFTIGRAVGFSAPGGIQTLGMITVAPGGALLPAVVFDTRTTPAPNPLDIVEPDQPGLPARQQATQVRVPGTEAPGDFGPASTAPAGTMVLNIDAGRSAVFLLLDGGTATGEIASAGRLAIHGTGGSADLSGRLTDVSGTPVDGAAAARFADSTRPAASGALSRYRLNGCVVSSVNCIVPSQIISIPQAPPQQVDLRLGNNRITDPEVQVPNVGDEDY